MHEPSTPTFQHIQGVMASGDCTGHNRPTARVTYVKRRIRNHRSERPGPWRNLLFPWGVERTGLPAVHSMNMSRSLDSDSATCTIVFVNDYMRRDAFAPQGIDTGIGRPGYYTPDRGEDTPLPGESVYQDLGPVERFPTDWDYPYAGAGNSPNANYYKLLIPNRIVFTYQGYGSDNFNEYGQDRYVHAPGFVAPWDDTKVLPTGVWLIDSVDFGSDGFITVECRDMGKLLLEQYIYPPMVPMDRFPLTYCPVTITETSEVSQESVALSLSGSGNDYWLSWNASIYGHRPSHAFDGSGSTYWLSIGNAGPRFSWSFEWIQGSVGREIDQIVVNPVWSGHTMFVSVRENGQWQGGQVVPYDPKNVGAPNKSNIPYVKRVTNVPRGSQVIALPRTYQADDVRVCFTNLHNSGLGTYPFRAAVRSLGARLSTETITTSDDLGEPGVITDWSDAVKELVSWAGLTWHDSIEPHDQVLGRTISGDKPLRAWGDFEILGAGPIECTPSNYFLNKSFMEAVTQIKDFLGLVFFIDEWGGAIFRHPNVFSGGNFITDPFGEDLFNEYSALFNEGIYNQQDSSGLLTRGQMATVVVNMLSWLGYSLPAPGSDKFTDISTSVHRDNINILAELEITVGIEGGLEYDPGADTTRGQAATFAVKAAEWMTGVPITASTEDPYSDISGSFHETNILKAYEAGLMIGYPGGTFRPLSSLTRFQSAVVMYRLGDYEGTVMPYVIAQREDANSQISTVRSVYIESWPIELHENSNLLDYQVTVNDSQLRSEILVIGETPDIESGLVAGGIDLVDEDSPLNFREVLAGQTRMFQVPADATQGFKTQIECQRMAEITALFILFTYRRGSATALAHPGLQLDDQIRIFERVTNERNVHYVSAIQTRFDADTGEYTMELTTHWLGKDPNTEWFLDELVLTDAIRSLPRIEARLAEAEQP